MIEKRHMMMNIFCIKFTFLKKFNLIEKKCWWNYALCKQRELKWIRGAFLNEEELDFNLMLTLQVTKEKNKS